MELPEELLAVQKRIRVLRDRVLIRPLQYEHPVLATVGVDIHKGIVIAVGYGRRQRRKTPFHQKMDGCGTGTDKTIWFEDGEETGRVLPMQVQPGDIVEFSFRNIEIVNFDRIYDHKSNCSRGPYREPAFPDIGDLVFVWQSAIMSIDPEESLSDAMLWQQSAGYDRKGNFLSGAESWDRG
jgi:hypothetical protein